MRRSLRSTGETSGSDALVALGESLVGHVASSAALGNGLRRGGAHLYPALPYEHFTHVDDADLHALYAYLMTRRAVQVTAPQAGLEKNP